MALRRVKAGHTLGRSVDARAASITESIILASETTNHVSSRPCAIIPRTISGLPLINGRQDTRANVRYAGTEKSRAETGLM
jgi:hypothetical protein